MNGQSPPTVFERHFTPKTLAELWSLSEDTIQRWAEDEDGVLRCGSEGGRNGRRRVTLRIPETVAMRMYQKHVKRE